MILPRYFPSLLLLVLSLLWSGTAVAQHRTNASALMTSPDSSFHGREKLMDSARPFGASPILLPDARLEPQSSAWPYGRYTTMAVVSGALILGLGSSLTCDTNCGWAFPLGALMGGSAGYVVGCVADGVAGNWKLVPGCAEPE